MTEMTQTEFAAKWHVTVTTVSNWRRDGYLVRRRNGKVDVERSEARLRARPDPHKNKGPGADASSGDVSIKQSRDKQRRHEARIAERRYLRESAAYMAADEVPALLEKHWATVRCLLDRIAPAVKAPSVRDPFQWQEALVDAINDVLTQFQEKQHATTKQVKASIEVTLPDDANAAQVRQHQVRFEAAMRELEDDREAGRIVAVDGIVREFGAKVAVVRSQLFQLPGLLAPALAATAGEAEAKALVSGKVSAIVEELTASG
jgi:hypothetical protein